ncbi:NAD(P)-dependent dehydrogenase (short-subunit alcohol dehydrogenase family) [Arcticibacter pallidicorallinus]|uniref:NAD(P)-dependent dehydrogenase (Short-subunit alcohol dehydrogenase family) n=1 Tax=Arcticibacter pallidicorallinus TaxID=1259464 RepID=A0A2T0TVV6_9SPHI|nr:SDR family oxidoreductase [Arcticibacter pallidicorallinus]PRY49836.1 NAD(P)-dependent dehydrogenase (short-subunit alcohol dehydrogenase family) [Arcticibacter pallidicorallinus]
MKILITGVSSGVGFEAVLDMIQNGDHEIIALARSEDKLKRLYEIALGLNPDCKLYPAKFDIVHDDYTSLVNFVKQKVGTLDVLINNAGQLIQKPFGEISQIDFAAMLQSNLMGHIKMIQNMLPVLNDNAHVVNIGSMAGFTGSVKFPGMAAYAASKAALHALTECLAVEYTERNIHFNCLALGSAQTEMLEEAFPGYQSPVMAFEMGKYIADFALNAHKFFNGKVLPVAVTTP